MGCERCGKDSDTIVLLPIKQPDGRYNTMACVECSIASGHYCQKHDRPHLGFEDETSACIICIEERVTSDGEKIAGVFGVAAQASRNFPDLKEALDEYLEGIEFGLGSVTLADLPLAARIVQTNTAQNIARPIVTYSLRKKIPIEQAIERAIEKPHVVFLGYSEQEL